MLAAVISILILYCLMIVLFWIGWRKSIGRNTMQKLDSPMISVIVAVRNEEKNIKNLLEDLHQQRYQNFEVIVVDDHSQDNSLQVIKRSSMPNFQLLANRGEGKKSAITTGIRVAKGAIIMTTDADCRVSQEWVSEVGRFFGDAQVKLAFGGVRIAQNSTFFSKLQSIEFASLIGSGAATAALGFPTMCNGANLAYRKTVFEEVNGYEGNIHVPSGDDEFLMRKISRRFPDGIRFMNSADAIVETKAQPDIESFYYQRLRWAGKWKFNTSRFTVALSIFVLLSQIGWIAGIINLGRNPNIILTGILFCKVFFDGFFLFRVCRFLKVNWNWLAFITLQSFYAFYVLIVGVSAHVISYQWKGRIIKNAR